MIKKLLIGIGLLAFVVGVGAAIYFVFFRAAPTPPPAAPTPPDLIPINVAPLPARPSVPAPIPGALREPTVGEPVALEVPTTPPATTIAQGGVTTTRTLTDTPVQFFDVSGAGQTRFYDASAGRFYRLDANGNPVPLSDQVFPNVRSIAWAPTDDRAILEFPDGANVFYDFATNQQVTLPRHWEEFSFSPRGDRIAGLSVGLDPENRFLFEAEPNGNGFRAIEPLGTNQDRVEVAWSPNNQVVAFSRTGRHIGEERQRILAIGRNGENFPGVVVEGTDFRPLWSPSGSHLLFSSVHSSNDYKPELWIVGGQGDSIGAGRKRLRVDTWADKCTFGDATTLFCAVPERLDRGFGLNPRLAQNIPDTIERIDLNTGVRTTVGRPETDASITTLRVAPDGSRLFFTGVGDGRLQEIRLR